MENLENKLKDLIKKNEELNSKIEALDSSILNHPFIPEDIKEGIRKKREDQKKPDITDGLIISNKIIGYDPETFDPIYE